MLLSPLTTTHSDGNRIKKSRIRIPTSCSTCRSKKIKCDKKRPSCTNCLLKDGENSCTYETQPWPKDTPNAEAAIERLQEEIMGLKGTIRSLESTVEVQRRESGNASVGSTDTSLPSLFDSDETTRGKQHGNRETVDLSRLSHRFCIKNLKVLYFGPTSHMFLLMNDSYSAAVFSDYLNEQSQKFKLKSTSLEIQNDAAFSQNGPTVVDCTKVETIAPDEPLVLPTLPSLRIVNGLIQRFFKLCYIFAPIIDERIFMNEVGQIFKNKETIDHDDLCYRSSTIAILLIMLRFAYLTIPLKKNQNNHLGGPDDLLQLIENTNANISSSYVEYAQHLILRSRGYEKIDFRKIQAVLFLKVYRMHCPEDEDKTSGSNILVAIAAQMARFHGLHKDPSTLTVLTIDNSDIHLWRKTWASLLYLDSLQAFEFGMPLIVEDNGSDTKEPFRDLLSNEFWSSNDTVANSFNIKCTTTRLLRKAAKLLNQGNDLKMIADIEELLSEFDDLLNNRIRPFEVLYNSRGLTAELIEAAYEIMLRMMISHYLFTLQYLLYLSATGEAKEKYLYLSVENAFTMFGVSLQFVDDASIVVCPEFETLVAPQIWNLMKTVMCVLGGLLVRILTGEVSLYKAAKTFRSSSIAATFWAKIVHENKEECLKNFLCVIEQFYGTTVQLSVKYFHCFLLCFTVKIILDYFKSKYPEMMQTINYSTIDANTDRIVGGVMLVDEFWNNTDLRLDYTFEEFLAHLNYNNDPFINSIT